MTEKTDYPRFADFNTRPIGFEGDKLRMQEILGREILITGFRILSGKYKTAHCVQFQFELDGMRYVTFSGSAVVANQLTENRDRLPFYATLRRIDRYITLS